jgi:hypothetical protein
LSRCYFSSVQVKWKNYKRIMWSSKWVKHLCYSTLLFLALFIWCFTLPPIHLPNPAWWLADNSQPQFFGHQFPTYFSHFWLFPLFLSYSLILTFNPFFLLIPFTIIFCENIEHTSSLLQIKKFKIIQDLCAVLETGLNQSCLLSPCYKFCVIPTMTIVHSSI